MYHNHAGTAHTAQRPKSAATSFIPSRRGEPAHDWQSQAVETYSESRLASVAGLLADMTARIYALTGRTLAPESIYVDYDDIFAVAVLDGRTFRLRHGRLVLLRPCVECGLKHFESPAILSQIDLGYALGKWEPRCASCQSEDPLGWLNYID
jgi:hypothetical protein